MLDTTPFSRRRMLKIGAVGAVGVGALSVPLGRAASGKSASDLATANFPRPYQATFQRPPVLQPTSSTVDGDGIRTNFYTVTEMQSTAQIVPGLTTPVWAYNGSVPGPMISLDQGTRAVLKVRNQLPATHPTFGHAFATSTHLHGSASLPQYDGYASDVTPPGYVKDYKYPNFQAARTLWYHDHGVHFTAQNAYGGLAAQYHMHDPVERALLPQGEFDVPITITDAQFAAEGKLSYDDHTESGLWGDIILVNGKPLAGDAGEAPGLPVPDPRPEGRDPGRLPVRGRGRGGRAVRRPLPDRRCLLRTRHRAGAGAAVAAGPLSPR